MSDSITVDKSLTIEEQYKFLISQIKLLLDKDDNSLSNLSNFTAALKQTFQKISWVGFYLYDGEKLFLGPFQGKVACSSIAIGKGVCGTSAKLKTTIIVPDVSKFPGHISCDPDSNSEIVIPIIKDGNLFGVLDLDSTDLNSFSEVDKKYLEEICQFLVTEIL